VSLKRGLNGRAVQAELESLVLRGKSCSHGSRLGKESGIASTDTGFACVTVSVTEAPEDKIPCSLRLMDVDIAGGICGVSVRGP